MDAVTWPIVVHLVVWCTHADKFLKAQKITKCDFGGKHITLDEDKETAYAEVFTAINEASLQAVDNSMGWVVFTWHLPQLQFANLCAGYCADLHLRWAFPTSHPTRRAWRFYSDIDLEKLPCYSVKAEKMQAIGFDRWSQKALEKMEKMSPCSSVAPCSDCNKCHELQWKGNDMYFCAECWWKYFVKNRELEEGCEKKRPSTEP